MFSCSIFYRLLLSSRYLDQELPMPLGYNNLEQFLKMFLNLNKTNIE